MSVIHARVVDAKQWTRVAMGLKICLCVNDYF
jgi:hypothetical protein